MVLTKDYILRITQQALTTVGTAIVPQLQAGLQEELSKLTLEEMDPAVSQNFSDQAFQAMKATLLAEITDHFSKASLAAIGELSQRLQPGLTASKQRIASSDFFANAAEGGSDGDATNQPVPTAEQPAAAQDGPPAGSAMPLTEGGMPVAKPGQPTAQPNPYDLRKAQRQESQQTTTTAPAGSTQDTSSGTTAASPTPTYGADDVNAGTAPPSEQPAEAMAGNATAPAAAMDATTAAPSTAETAPAASANTAATPSSADTQAPASGGIPTNPGDLQQALVAKAASKLAGKLADNIKNGVMQNYQLIIGLALLKDAIDVGEILYGDPGITGMIVDVIAKVVFAALLAGQKNTFRKRLIKKYVGRILIALCIELVPLAEFIPTYTIDAITIYVDNEITRRREKGQLQQVQSMMKRLKGKRRKPSQANLRNYNRSINDINKQADT